MMLTMIVVVLVAEAQVTRANRTPKRQTRTETACRIAEDLYGPMADHAETAISVRVVYKRQGRFFDGRLTNGG